MTKIYTPKILLVFFASVLLTALFLTGCKKNYNESLFINPNPPDLTTTVKSSVSGFVTDENDQAVNLATVQVGSTTINTDKYGYFEVRNVDVVQTAAVVTVIKTGYFKGIKTYMAEAGKSAFFRIKLIPKTNSGTVNGTAGGAITLANGLSITLPANAVVNATSNTAYTGTVNVAAYWINPTATDLPGIMPGDLRGINSAGNLQLLTTYGMAAVELTGSGGELLQIATGKKATLSLPIPSSLLSSAPASIPLWYFDEAKGLWKQEGTATKTGNNYVGEVSHFSFWNCDVPANYVQLSATLVTGLNNQPLQYALVKISVVGNPANFRYGYTDSSGYVSGLVPSNTQLLFEVLSNVNCTTPEYSQNVTTATANISLGTIPITLSNNFAMITGTVVNCSNAPVTNGYVMLLIGNKYFQYNLSNTGTYSGILLLCNNTAAPVTLIAEDLTAHTTSGPVIFNIAPGNNTVPPLQACSASQLEYVTITKNNITQTYRYLFVYPASPTSIGIGFFADPTRTIPAGHLEISKTGIANGSIQDLISISTGGSNMIISNPPVNVFITEYGLIGQFISGNFSGNFIQPPTNTAYTITCDFRIKRIF